MRTGWIVVAAALLAAPLQAESVRAGIEAWQRGDHSAAVKIWRPLAERGDADAAFNLGQAHRLGRGVPLDLGSAQLWLEKAAAKGHVDAQTTLGLLLFENGNRIAGLRWLRSAAERGEARALLIYGTALFNGDGVKRDPVLAYAYVSRAAAQGLAPAKSTLAEMDQILPLEQRQQGVRLALAKADPQKAAAAKARGPSPAAVAKPVPVPPSQSGSWRIQLGAFSKSASAQALFNRLSASAPVAGRRPFLIPAGAVTRLQVGPFATREAAAAACATLRTRGQPCFPVAAK